MSIVAAHPRAYIVDYNAIPEPATLVATLLDCLDCVGFLRRSPKKSSVRRPLAQLLCG